jgi:outer membrane protein assembly factor BamB
VLLSGHAPRLFCLEYATGKIFWEAETTGGGRASIVVEGKHIFVAKGGEVNCFDWKGKRRWSQPLSGAGRGRAALGFSDNVRQADEHGS